MSIRKSGTRDLSQEEREDLNSKKFEKTAHREIADEGSDQVARNYPDDE